MQVDQTHSLRISVRVREPLHTAIRDYCTTVRSSRRMRSAFAAVTLHVLRKHRWLIVLLLRVHLLSFRCGGPRSPTRLPVSLVRMPVRMPARRSVLQPRARRRCSPRCWALQATDAPAAVAGAEAVAELLEALSSSGAGPPSCPASARPGRLAVRAQHWRLGSARSERCSCSGRPLSARQRRWSRWPRRLKWRRRQRRLHPRSLSHSHSACRARPAAALSHPSQLQGHSLAAAEDGNSAMLRCSPRPAIAAPLWLRLSHPRHQLLPLQLHPLRPPVLEASRLPVVMRRTCVVACWRHLMVSATPACAS